MWILHKLFFIDSLLIKTNNINLLQFFGRIMTYLKNKNKYFF